MGIFESHLSAFGGDDSSSVPRMPARYTFRDGGRYAFMDGSSMGPTRMVDCDVIGWNVPDGQYMIAHIIVPCARCNFPIYVQPSNFAMAQDDAGRLTLKTPVACPAHWTNVNNAGHVQGARVKCGWVAIIRQGRAHNPNCPAANFHNSHDAHLCTCGGLLTEAELQRLEQGA